MASDLAKLLVQSADRAMVARDRKWTASGVVTSSAARVAVVAVLRELGTVAARMEYDLGETRTDSEWLLALAAQLEGGGRGE